MPLFDLSELIKELTRTKLPEWTEETFADLLEPNEKDDVATFQQNLLEREKYIKQHRHISTKLSQLLIQYKKMSKRDVKGQPNKNLTPTQKKPFRGVSSQTNTPSAIVKVTPKPIERRPQPNRLATGKNKEEERQNDDIGEKIKEMIGLIEEPNTTEIKAQPRNRSGTKGDTKTDKMSSEVFVFELTKVCSWIKEQQSKPLIQDICREIGEIKQLIKSSNTTETKPQAQPRQNATKQKDAKVEKTNPEEIVAELTEIRFWITRKNNLVKEIDQKIQQIQQLKHLFEEPKPQPQKKTTSKNDKNTEQTSSNDLACELSKIRSWIQELTEQSNSAMEQICKVLQLIEEPATSGPKSTTKQKTPAKETAKGDKSRSEDMVSDLTQVHSWIEKQLQVHAQHEQMQAQSGTQLLKKTLMKPSETQHESDHSDSDFKHLEDIIKATEALVRTTEDKVGKSGTQSTKRDKGKENEESENLLPAMTQIQSWIQRSNKELDNITKVVREVKLLTEGTDITKPENNKTMKARAVANSKEPVDLMASLNDIRSWIKKQIDDDFQTRLTELETTLIQLKNLIGNQDSNEPVSAQEALSYISSWIKESKFKISKSKDYKAMIDEWLENIQPELSTEEPIETPAFTFGNSTSTTKAFGQIQECITNLKARLREFQKQISESNEHTDQGLKSFTLLQDICQEQLQKKFKQLNKDEKRSLTKVGERAVEMVTDLTESITEINKKCRAEMEENRLLREKMRKLEETISELKNRLSRYMGADLMVGNPNIADLSDTKRPTKLAESFSELYDNDWTNAFEELHTKKKWKEVDVIRNLFEVLKFAFDCCSNAAAKQLTELEFRSCTPALALVEKSKQDFKQVKLDPVSQQALNDFRKKTWAFASANISQHSEEIMKREKKWNDAYRSEPCKKYINSCMDLCWLMVIQSPPLYIEFGTEKKSKFEPEKYKEYMKKGKQIDFVVWPPLYMHKGGAMLSKGVAEGK